MRRYQLAVLSLLVVASFGVYRLLISPISAEHAARDYLFSYGGSPSEEVSKSFKVLATRSWRDRTVVFYSWMPRLGWKPPRTEVFTGFVYLMKDGQRWKGISFVDDLRPFTTGPSPKMMLTISASSATDARYGPYVTVLGETHQEAVKYVEFTFNDHSRRRDMVAHGVFLLLQYGPTSPCLAQALDGQGRVLDHLKIHDYRKRFPAAGSNKIYNNGS